MITYCDCGSELDSVFNVVVLNGKQAISCALKAASTARKKIKLSLPLIKFNISPFEPKIIPWLAVLRTSGGRRLATCVCRVMESLVWAVSVEILALPVMGSVVLYRSQAGDGQASLEKLGRVWRVVPP